MISINAVGVAVAQQTVAKLADAPDAAVRALAQRIYDLAETAADKHTKTGALRRSLYLRSVSGGYAIGHDLKMAPHAIFVHWGTRPHIIKPSKRKVLRWAAGGRFIFAKWARHPGYKGDPYLITSANQAVAEFPAMLARITGDK